jgi:hypothetical protein
MSTQPCKEHGRSLNGPECAGEATYATYTISYPFIGRWRVRKHQTAGATCVEPIVTTTGT